MIEAPPREALPRQSQDLEDTTFGFWHSISGRLEIEEKNGETKTYCAGERFFLKSGLVGVWRTIEACARSMFAFTSRSGSKVHPTWAHWPIGWSVEDR